MSSSERFRPNQVPYQVKKGTMIKRAARMIRGQFPCRSDGATVAWRVLPLGFTNSFPICHLTFVICHLVNRRGREGFRRGRRGRIFTTEKPDYKELNLLYSELALPSLFRPFRATISK